MTVRYALIGAHPKADEVEGVIWFNASGLALSAIEFDSEHGIAEPGVIRRALIARKELVARQTFIAIRYGAAVAGPEEARTICSPHLERWKRILESRGGMVEVTLRIAGKKKAAPPNRKDFQRGGDYLRALHRQRLSHLDPELTAWIESLFAPVSSARTWVGRPDGSSELVLLVPRNRLEEVGQVAEKLKMSRPDLPFLISGPWPLETFAHEEG